MHPLIIMFVLLKRKGVGERGRELGRGGTVEEVHEKEKAGLHGVDMWTKDTCSITSYQARDLDIMIGKGKWKDTMQHHL